MPVSMGSTSFPPFSNWSTYDQLNAVAAYGGFPTRYPHWRFGMEFERLQKGYSYGLQKIYELVINNNPCYAYLLEQQLLDRPSDGHCSCLRPLRFLQAKRLVRSHFAEDDRRDGQPWQSHSALHGPLWRRRRGGVH